MRIFAALKKTLMPKKFNALLDAMDTFLRTPATVTGQGSHIRDSVDMKRIMITVMIALCPALIFGWWNVGYQHFLAIGDFFLQFDDKRGVCIDFGL